MQKKNGADGVISPDSLVRIMVDVYLADATLTTSINTKKISQPDVNKYYSDVLQKHNITKERFDLSVKYYCNDKEKFMKIYDEVLAELNARQILLQTKQADK